IGEARPQAKVSEDRANLAIRFRGRHHLRKDNWIAHKLSIVTSVFYFRRRGAARCEQKPVHYVEIEFPRNKPFRTACVRIIREPPENSLKIDERELAVCISRT